MRLALGLAGLASLSAMATSVMAAPPDSAAVAQVSLVYPTARPVQHVTRYVWLAPGQTAPPEAATQQLPAPPPKIVIITTTRQSAKKP